MEDQFQNYPVQDNRVITTGEWFLTLLITAIPLVGIIMLFVWAFSGGTNPNKSNWAKAQLIWMVLAIVLVAILIVVFYGFDLKQKYYWAGLINHHFLNFNPFFRFNPQ